MTDGPSINIWNAVSVGVWTIALGLLIGDQFIAEGDIGPLFGFALFTALVGAVLAAAGVARRCKEEILEQLRNAIDLGHEAGVREIHRSNR